MPAGQDSTHATHATHATRVARAVDGGSRGEKRKETKGVSDNNLAREAAARRARGEEDMAQHVCAHVVLPHSSEIQGLEKLDEASTVLWLDADSLHAHSLHADSPVLIAQC